MRRRTFSVDDTGWVCEWKQAGNRAWNGSQQPPSRAQFIPKDALGASVGAAAFSPFCSASSSSSTLKSSTEGEREEEEQVNDETGARCVRTLRVLFELM